ncbi:hypothetical protein QN277_015873 [Acacia crassicarpa]|uniref:Replication protein A 70 kDa DNA-binding subunit B/D first OB fold domain-containing protein n=1 Tax=Acacia crassicarpa TaxID=499986 RepID=A0AAE1MUB6_9FABA|nr:hypothetical protein QN277_015873 [Acacia crassicarpa]
MVSTVFDAVRTLTPKRHNWRICVRIARMWNMTARQGHGDTSSLELVLQDVHGDRVHASVRSVFVHRHDKHLEEGTVVDVSNFAVAPATGSYRPTEHLYRVNFQFGTVVRPRKDDQSIPRYGFGFKTFSDILSSDFDDRFLFGE